MTDKEIISQGYNSLAEECSSKLDIPSAAQIIIDGVDVNWCERKRKLNTIIVENKIAKVIIKSKKYGIKEVLIDIEDVEKIKNNTWRIVLNKTSNRFYACSIAKNNSTVYMHNLIMDTPKGYDTDHINRDLTLDNRKANLRIVTRRQNLLNIRDIKTNNKSGYKNIYFNKQRNKWVVDFTIKGKTHYLGGYSDLQEAIRVRNNFKEGELYNG